MKPPVSAAGPEASPLPPSEPHQGAAGPSGRRSDRVFWFGLCVLGGSYVALILALLVADAAYRNRNSIGCHFLRDHKDAPRSYPALRHNDIR